MMMFGTLTLTFPFTADTHPAHNENAARITGGKTYPYDSRFAELYMAALEREIIEASHEEGLCIIRVIMTGHFELASASSMEKIRRLIQTRYILSDDCEWILDSEASDQAEECNACPRPDDGRHPDFRLGCGMGALTVFPEGAYINTDDLILYLSHPNEVDLIARAVNPDTIP